MITTYVLELDGMCINKATFSKVEIFWLSRSGTAVGTAMGWEGVWKKSYSKQKIEAQERSDFPKES